MSPLPLNEQLKNILREEIFQGVYAKKIPSERELMDRFSVSRSTVRKAVLDLVNEGVLEKIHGKGTFVSFKPVEEWLGNLSSFNEVIKQMGMTPKIELLEHGLTGTPKEAGSVLGLKEFYYITRLRYADNSPISLEKQYYSPEIGRKLMKHDLNNAVIYDLLENSLGITLWEAEQIITSRLPSKSEASLLKCSKTLCLMVSQRFVNDPNGNPVEYEKSVIRSDMYAFRMKLARRVTSSS